MLDTYCATGRIQLNLAAILQYNIDSSIKVVGEIRSGTTFTKYRCAHAMQSEGSQGHIVVDISAIGLEADYSFRYDGLVNKLDLTLVTVGFINGELEHPLTFCKQLLHHRITLGVVVGMNQVFQSDRPGRTDSKGLATIQHGHFSFNHKVLRVVKSITIFLGIHACGAGSNLSFHGSQSVEVRSINMIRLILVTFPSSSADDNSLRSCDSQGDVCHIAIGHNGFEFYGITILGSSIGCLGLICNVFLSGNPGIDAEVDGICNLLHLSICQIQLVSPGLTIDIVPEFLDCFNLEGKDRFSAVADDPTAGVRFGSNNHGLITGSSGIVPLFPVTGFLDGDHILTEAILTVPH